ncbi:MAG: DUF4296 domain-containing protein [Bacteroidales bacterium]
MKKISILIFTLILLVSCSKTDIIPKETMVNIYLDMYMTDAYLNTHIATPSIGSKDSVLVYEPIFHKYGYKREDFFRSTTYYLKKPTKYKKIFEEVKNKLVKKERILNHIINRISDSLLFTREIDSIPLWGDTSLINNGRERAYAFFFYKDPEYSNLAYIKDWDSNRIDNSFLKYRNDPANYMNYIIFENVNDFFKFSAKDSTSLNKFNNILENKILENKNKILNPDNSKYRKKFINNRKPLKEIEKLKEFKGKREL